MHLLLNAERITYLLMLHLGVFTAIVVYVAAGIGFTWWAVEGIIDFIERN